MNLQELRERFVKMVGNNNLVGRRTSGGVTTVDYSVDNGADFYINEGVRVLDEILPWPGSYRREELDLDSGEYSISVPRLRSIEKAIAVLDSDSDSTYELRLRTLKELYTAYKEPFENVDAGCPVFIARGAVEQITTALLGAELVENGDFSDGTTGWTVGTDWSLSGSSMVVAAGADTVERLLMRELSERIVGSTAKVVINVTFTATPVSETNRLWFDIGSTNLGVIQLGSITSSGEHEIDVFIDEIDFVAVRAGVDFEGSVSEISIKNRVLDSQPPVLVLPPADANYTVYLYGNFWSETLEENTDTNYWAANYPGLVLLAAAVWHEVTLRNMSGANDWRKELDRRLLLLDNDAAQEDTERERYLVP